MRKYIPIIALVASIFALWSSALAGDGKPAGGSTAQADSVAAQADTIVSREVYAGQLSQQRETLLARRAEIDEMIKRLEGQILLLDAIRQDSITFKKPN